MEGRDQSRESGRVHEDHARHEFEEDDDDRCKGRQADAANARAFTDDLGHWPLDQEEVQEHASQRDGRDQHRDQPRHDDRRTRSDLPAILGPHDLLELDESLVHVARILVEVVLDLHQLFGDFLQARALVPDCDKRRAQRRQLVVHRTRRVGSDVLLDLGQPPRRLHRRQGGAEGALCGVFQVDVGNRIGARRQFMCRLVQLLQDRAGLTRQLLRPLAHLLFEMKHPVLQLVGALRSDLLVGNFACAAAVIE